MIDQLQLEDGGHRLWVHDHHTWIAAHAEYLADDGIHLTTAGYVAYAARMAASVGESSLFASALDRVEQVIGDGVGQLV